jgi:hypothetical protein
VALAYCFCHRAVSRSRDPLVRPRRKNRVDLFWRDRPCLWTVPSNQRQAPAQWGYQKGGGVPQARRRRIEAIRNAPSDWSIADDEEATHWGPECEPSEPGKPSCLEVVSPYVNAL